MNRTINELAASFAKREGVEALVLAGSAVTGFADEESDYDLYAYTREAVPVEFRAKLLKPRAARLELYDTFWEWSDEWVEPDGTCFDLMYRSCDAFEADVEARLGRGQLFSQQSPAANVRDIPLPSSTAPTESASRVGQARHLAPSSLAPKMPQVSSMWRGSRKSNRSASFSPKSAHCRPRNTSLIRSCSIPLIGLSP